MSDDYSKMSKTELIDLVKSLESDLTETESINIELNNKIRELDLEIQEIEAKLTREQFAHEMTVEESEQFRSDLLDARLESYAINSNKKFWINSKGNRITIKHFNPPF